MILNSIYMTVQILYELLYWCSVLYMLFIVRPTSRIAHITNILSDANH